MERLRGLGAMLLYAAVLCALVVVGLAVFRGAGWVAARALPWSGIAFWIAAACCIFLFAPMALFRASRGASAMGLLLASYLFGVILWLWSFFVTLQLWGAVWTVIGLFFAGVGLVPFALLAAAFHGSWPLVGNLVLMLVATGVTRIASFWIVAKLERVPAFG